MTAIKNPCVGVCKIHPIRKTCNGCHRTRLQIVKWPNYSDKEKFAVINEAKEREILYNE